jgi:hemoglobin-like flavoprotein
VNLHLTIFLSLLLPSFFIRCPEAQSLFDSANASLAISDDEKYTQQGALVIQMLDTALNMMGPDLEALTEMLIDQGAKNLSYGIEAHMYPMMQLALCDTLEGILGSEVMTMEMKRSWSVLMAALADDMLTSQDASWSSGAYGDH